MGGSGWNGVNYARMINLDFGIRRESGNVWAPQRHACWHVPQNE